MRVRRKTTLPRARWGPGLRASWQHPLHGGGGAGRPGSTMQWSVFRPLHCRAEDRESHLPGAVALLIVSIFLGATCARSLHQYFFGPLVSGSSRTTCRRPLYQDAFGPLAPGSSRTTCAQSLFQVPSGPLRWDPFRPLYQNPVGQVVQGLCFRISV